MIPPTTERVRLHTRDPLNQEIDSRIHESVAFHATAPPEATDRRLQSCTASGTSSGSWAW